MTDPKDVYDEMIEAYRGDDPGVSEVDARRESLIGLDHQQLQAAAGSDEIEIEGNSSHMDAAALADALAEAGLFTGPIGDPRLYVRTDDGAAVLDADEGDR